MSKNKSLEQRVATILEAYDQQGIHRTGTTGDTENAHYLAEQIKAAGQKPLLTKLRHLRVAPIQSELQIGNWPTQMLLCSDAFLQQNQNEKNHHPNDMTYQQRPKQQHRCRQE